MPYVLFVLLLGSSSVNALPANLESDAKDLFRPGRGALVTEVKPGQFSSFTITSPQPPSRTWTVHQRDRGPELEMDEGQYLNVAETKRHLYSWRFSLARLTRRTVREMIRNLRAPIEVDNAILRRQLDKGDSLPEHMASKRLDQMLTFLQTADIVGWSLKDQHQALFVEVVFARGEGDHVQVEVMLSQPRLSLARIRTIKVTDAHARADANLTGYLGNFWDDRSMRAVVDRLRERLEDIGYIDALKGKVKKVGLVRRAVEACIDKMTGGNL